MCWEYKVVLLRVWNWSEQDHIDNTERTLNELGKEGWELIDREGRACMFKRPIQFQGTGD